MNSINLSVTADRNLQNLKKNTYPGRGLICGLDQHGTSLIQVYWIMGRSEQSRNRRFCLENNRLFTEIADLSKITPDTDLSLIIYDAMVVSDRAVHVVSNGNQTETVRHTTSYHLFGALSDIEYEPDKPNFTPRITATSRFSENRSTLTELSLIRKSLSGGDHKCDRLLYQYDDLVPGFGYCLTTYMGDGDPLPSFRGEPLLMPLHGNIEEIAKGYWQALNPDNRVSLAVKFIPINGSTEYHIINRHPR